MAPSAFERLLKADSSEENLTLVARVERRRQPFIDFRR
jgi:hypothetical protein